SYDNRALILHGSSGAGKSSLVRAGLYPKLVRTSNFWIVAQLFKTEDNPFDVLLDTLYQSLTSVKVTANSAARAIKGIRSATDEKLAGALKGVTALLDGKSLVLIVDNLDRYFNHDTPQSKRLLVLLRAAIRTRSIKVIGVLRSNQLPRVAKALDISVFEYDS